MWLGDPLIPSQLNETLSERIPGVSIARESSGSYYAYIDGSMKEVPGSSAPNQWQRLKVLVNPETLTTWLWLNGKAVFENHPLKPGLTFMPAVSFSVETEGPEGFAEVEIDDFTVHVPGENERENRFIMLLAEDFEGYEEGKFPENSGWRSINIKRQNQKKNQAENHDKPVLIYLDIESGEKSLILQSNGQGQVFVVKPFSLPANFPFDISDRPFVIRDAEKTGIDLEQHSIRGNR
jgi:hypothetical protein